MMLEKNPCVCVCTGITCKHTCIYEQVHVYVRACMNQKSISSVFPSCFFPCFLRHDLSLGLELTRVLGCLARKFQIPSSSPALGSEARAATANFCGDAREPNSDPYSYRADILLTDPPSQKNHLSKRQPLWSKLIKLT